MTKILGPVLGIGGAALVGAAALADMSQPVLKFQEAPAITAPAPTVASPVAATPSVKTPSLATPTFKRKATAPNGPA